MANHRLERINGQIQRELSLIIGQKMKDNRLNHSTLSITHVKTTPDLKQATIYISYMGDAQEKEEVLAILDKAKGFLRSNLGKVLKTHSTPALDFKIDDSVEYGLHIENILKGLSKGEASDEAGTDDDA